ncbi:hypothetical protein Pan189_00890 [Stratiformator vulcanicus]|uniref:Uncharacterized protein n=1 Tax=Stratiformator vulcanicus TaxID=2527980 RepID=A0A517QVQ8_9PLAN|nr:hypothetical protein Pan189_00890 [Stratiformator vulcanicus]
MQNNALHTEPRAARIHEIEVVRRGPAVNTAGSQSDGMLFETVPLTYPPRIHREVLERRVAGDDPLVAPS